MEDIIRSFIDGYCKPINWQKLYGHSLANIIHSLNGRYYTVYYTFILWKILYGHSLEDIIRSFIGRYYTAIHWQILYVHSLAGIIRSFIGRYYTVIISRYYKVIIHQQILCRPFISRVQYYIFIHWQILYCYSFTGMYYTGMRRYYKVTN